MDYTTNGTWKKCCLAALILILFGGIAAGAGAVEEETSPFEDTVSVEIFLDYRDDGGSGVIKLPTVTEIDDEYILSMLNKILLFPSVESAEEDSSPNACSCLYVPLESKGVTLMGRNMDLPLSEYPAWIFYVDADDRYRSFNMGYLGSVVSLVEVPTMDEVADTKEIPSLTYQFLQYVVTDAVNEKGLRIEANKRIASVPELNCTGTNPSSDIIVSNAVIIRYLIDRCANIEDVLELIPTINIYNPQNSVMNSNIALSMMDATGRFGVMEFANNKVIWHEGQPGHTNFWIDEDTRKISNVSNGMGRWESLQESSKTVTSEEDMWKAIEKVYREQFFTKYADEVTFDVVPDCRYNITSFLEKSIQLRDEGLITLSQEKIDEVKAILDQNPEYENKKWDADFLLNEENRDKVITCYNFMTDVFNQLSPKDIQDVEKKESSVFSYVSSSAEPVLHVKFFEHDEIFDFPAVEQKTTTAKSPFPVLGILAGLGAAVVLMKRRQ